MISTIFTLSPHGFGFDTYIQHLFFDAIADGGGWYAARFCQHLVHRIAVAVTFALVTSFCLVWLIG